MQESGYLSATRGRIAVVCQLHEPGYRFSAENVRTLFNLKQDDGYLSATWWRLVVICQLHEAVICHLYEEGWRLSLSYMRQDSGYLWTALGRLVICQLYEAGWQLSVSYMRQEVCVLSLCLEAWWRLSVSYIRILVFCMGVEREQMGTNT